MSNRFEGEFFMPTGAYEEARTVQLHALDDLGPGNQGSFGPKSASEARAVEEFAQERYIAPPTAESHCMDDRFEGAACQLPGNRAIAEVAGQYMDDAIEEIPLSRATGRKVQELVHMGREPFFHGDEISGKSGCAALLNQQRVLIYNNEHIAQIAGMTWTDLRLLGIDNLPRADIESAIKMGGQRAGNDDLWDATPSEIFDLAQQAGAPTEIFKGKHNTTGPRKDFSENTYDNQKFRHDHTTDEGEPLGALSITYGAYLKQLEEDGFSQTDIAKKLMQVSLFTNGILKLACSESAIGASVTSGMLN